MLLQECVCTCLCSHPAAAQILLRHECLWKSSMDWVPEQPGCLESSLLEKMPADGAQEHALAGTGRCGEAKWPPWDVPSATPALLEGFPFPWPCFQLGCGYFLAKFQSQELPCRAIGTVQPHSRALRLVWKSLEVCFYNFVFVSVFLLVGLIDWFALLCLFRIMKNKLCLQNCCLKRLRMQMKRFAGLLVTRICPSGGLLPVLASLWSQIFLFVLLRTSGALVFW